MMGLKCTDCAVIEDSLAGIKAAKAAGMTAVAIGRPEQLPGADLFYAETGELNLDDIETIVNKTRNMNMEDANLPVAKIRMGFPSV